MTDPNFLSVNFGNMDQLIGELTSIIGASKATADDYVARMNSTVGQNPENWDGQLGRDSWATLQHEIYGHIDRMHQILDNARSVTVLQGHEWPHTEAQIANIFNAI